MKRLFYFMSLFLGLMLTTSAFVACGDDDDKDNQNQNNNGQGGQGGGGGTTEITKENIVGAWYLVDENSEERLCISSMYFEANGHGMFTEYKAKAHHDWEPEVDGFEMVWSLDGKTVIMKADKGELKGDILSMTDSSFVVRRHLEEGTDEVTVHRLSNIQEGASIFAEMLAQKLVSENTQTPETPADAKSLIGTWSQGQDSYTFTERELTVKEEGRVVFQGEYKYQEGVIVYVENYDSIQNVNVFRVNMLYDNNVLTLINVPTDPEDYMGEYPIVLFRNGQSPNTPAADIQGKWWWYFDFAGEENYVRAGITIEGNKIDMIITPWAMRYVGTFTYSGGMLHIKYTDVYTARDEEGDHINPVNLESDKWTAVPIEDANSMPEDMLFIGNGQEAYCYLVGLRAVFQKVATTR